MGTFHLSGHPSFGDILPKGTFHFWGYIIYGDTPSVGEYHTAYGDTPSMGEYAGIPHRLWGSTTYGDIPIPFKTSKPIGASYLWGHPTFGDILPKGTFHFWVIPSTGAYHL